MATQAMGDVGLPDASSLTDAGLYGHLRGGEFLDLALPASDGTPTGSSADYLMRAYYSTTGRDHYWTSVGIRDFFGDQSGLPDPQNLSNFRVMRVIR